MADKKISELILAESLNDEDAIPVVQGNLTKKIKYKNIREVAVSPTQPTTNERVWIKKGKNLSKINSFNSVNTSQKIFTSRIEVDANTNYTISFKKARIEGVNITNNTVYGVAHIEIYNNSGELLNDISGQTYNFSTGSKDIQEVVLTPTDSAYMIIDFGNNNGDSNFNTSVSNIQVEQGPEATSYEPHVEKEILVKNDNGVFEKFYCENDIPSYIRSKTVTGTPDSNGFLVTGLGLNNVIIGISNASQTAFYTPFYGKTENRLTIKCETWQRVAITTEVTITIHYIPLN